MSEFEAIALTYSFVPGLGIAQILSAASSAIRNRHQRQLHWLPLLVANFARTGPLRDAAAILFFVALAFGLLFVWSSPTDVS